MLFQLIGKDKVLAQNKVSRLGDCVNLTHTWSYSPFYHNELMQYANLYCFGLSLENACEDKKRIQWNKLSTLHQSYEKSFKEAKVSVSKTLFYELLPTSFVEDYFGMKNEICEHVFKNYQKPENYDYLVGIEKLIKQISINKLNIDIEVMKKEKDDIKVNNLLNKIVHFHSYNIQYQNFGTVTGRLTTKKGSFPILTLNKNFRKFIKPNNNWFLEFDYNAADIRTFLALNGEQQPENDIHDWHASLMEEEYPREEIKRKFFAWFYANDIEAKFGIEKIDRAYNKINLLKKFYNGQEVNNPFGRKIQCNNEVALNYLVQSTSWDIFSRRVIALEGFMKKNNMKSKITILLHDSVVIDLRDEDAKHTKDMIEILSETDYGKFKVNVRVGSNFGSMEKVN